MAQPSIGQLTKQSYEDVRLDKERRTKMGDRVSISFKTGNNESVALFNHWGGKEFADVVREYLDELNNDLEEGTMFPLQRKEPNTVMVDFIRWLT